VLLSFGAHWFLVQVAGGDVAQILVSITGIVLMVGVAWLMAWYGSLPELFVVPKVAPIRDRERVSKPIASKT
jgi:hypothetical protein